MTGTAHLVEFKGFFHAPAKRIKAVGYGLAMDSCSFAPLHHCQGDAISRYFAVVRSVILLFFHGRPTAVFRRVTKMIFNPVYRMSGRGAFPHIFKESGIILPAFTDGPSGVVTVRQANPYAICPRLPAALTMPVYSALYILSHNLFCVISRCFKACAVHIFHQAAARSRIAKNKAISWGYEYSAAIASALPRAVMMRVHPQTANSCQSGEFLSCQIFRASHDRY